MLVLVVLGLRTRLLLAGPKQCLDLAIPLRVVFGGLDNDLLGEGLCFAIEGVSASVGVQFLLEFGIIGDAGGVYLVILSVICIEP